MDGLLIVDKPAGPSSHDVVARVRRVLRERRVGHTGTLDPLASGVLPLVVGRATRLARFLATGSKGYEARIRLGWSTDTRDAEGQAIGIRFCGPFPEAALIDRALDRFRGAFLQQPPAFSAKKIDGRRSYQLARARARQEHLRQALDRAPSEDSDAPGTRTLPSPVSVVAHSIELVEVNADVVTLRLTCSAGFYVRSLAHDLGEVLGTGAHLTALRRTNAAGANLGDAVTLAALEGDQGRERAEAALIALQDMLPALPRLVLTEEGTRRASTGCDVGLADTTSAFPVPSSPQYRLVNLSGALIGIAEPATTPGLLHPVVVLV